MTRFETKMFLPQDTLELWLESGNVDFEGTVVTLKAHKVSYQLEPAVRITNLIAGLVQSNLVGKVLSQRRVAENGGEILEDSVVFGEVAFQVTPGYVAA